VRKLLISGVGVLSAFLLVGPAIAADIAVKPKRERAAAPQRTTQTQQSSNWSGSQAGGSNGGSSVNNNFVEPGAFNYAPGCFGPCYETPFQFSDHKVSYIIGGFLGYRVQMGNIVVGVEGDVYWKNAESSKVQNTPPPWLGYEQFTGSQKQGVDGSLRLRVGTLVTPWTLLYATGGLAVGRVSGSFSYAGCEFSDCIGGTNVFGSATWSETRVGGTVGAGVETEIFPGVKARGEYRYTDLGKFSKDVPLQNNSGGSCPPTTCGTTAHIDLKATNHRFTFGLGIDLPGI